MIELRHGDIFKSGAEALVNAVNCVGVSGKGIAAVFKRRFPQNQDAYEAACELGEITLGNVFAFHEGQFWVINFPSKFHWKEKSHLKDIETGLKSLVERVQLLNIRSVAIPALGCGLGGLDWEDVRPMIEKAFEDSEARVFIYEPL